MYHPHHLCWTFCHGHAYSVGMEVKVLKPTSWGRVEQNLHFFILDILDISINAEKEYV